jgi:formylglycine-generating enzyme required for sulfatase activity
VWQINLRYEIQEYQIRSAEIGLQLNTPNFPYTNGGLSDIRYFVEKQEDLYPKMERLKTDAAKSGLKKIPLTPPYTTQQFQTWSKAVDSFLLERVPSGESEIGSPYGFVDERPIFTVKISRDIFFMNSEVSQALYRAIMQKNPNVKDSCLDCPVTNVNWMDSIIFANKLSLVAGFTPCYKINNDLISWENGIECLGFRLPTEAEWEYAARAQSEHTYSGAMDSTEVAWFNGNSGLKLKSAGRLKPNDFNLFDMNGNAWEWCWDRYGDYVSGVFKDPIGSRDGGSHVIRGGSYQTGLTTVSGRAEHNPDGKALDIGFRLVRTAVIGNLPKDKN